jgi:hypothetical protein
LAGREPPAREDQLLEANRLAVLVNELLDGVDRLCVVMLALDPRGRLCDWRLVIDELARVSSQLRGEKPVERRRDVFEAARESADRLNRGVRASEGAARTAAVTARRERLGELWAAMSRGMHLYDDDVAGVNEASQGGLRMTLAVGAPYLGKINYAEVIARLPDFDRAVAASDELFHDCLANGSQAEVVIATELAQGAVSVQLSGYVVPALDRAWVVQVPLVFVQNGEYLMPPALMEQFFGWSGPLMLGLESSMAEAERFGRGLAETGARLFSTVADLVDRGVSLADNASWAEAERR